jgi:hypothetical protein
MLSELVGIGKRERNPEMLRRRRESCRVVPTALISKSGSACRAGM